MTITLLDGRSVDTANITYNPARFTFIYRTPDGFEDVTNNLRLIDMARFPAFDQVSFLQNRSYQARPGPKPGSTSTFVNFWEQITTDPLAAPLEGAGNLFSRGVEGIFGNVNVQKIIITALIVGGVYWWLTSRKD